MAASTASMYEDQGIVFKVITPEMYDDVMDFLWANFFPEEPLMRSLGVTRLPFIDKYVFPETFAHNCSMAAMDGSGNILAVRVGGIKRRRSWSTWMTDKAFQVFPYRLFSCVLPPSMHKMPIFVKLCKKIGFNAWSMFGVWNCEAVYEVREMMESMMEVLPS